MNKKGFTLMELLIVILIVSVVSVGSMISFGNVDDSTAKKERINQYVEIQRAAGLYMDLHDSTLKEFVSRGNEGYVLIKLYTLQEEGYIDKNLEDPVTTNELPNNHSVVLYVDNHNNSKTGKDVQSVGSCIVDTDLDYEKSADLAKIDNKCIDSNGSIYDIEDQNRNPRDSKKNYYACIANQDGEHSTKDNKYCNCDCIRIRK